MTNKMENKEITLYLEYFDDDVCELMNKYIKKGFISEKGELFFDDDDIVDDFNYHIEGLKKLIKKTISQKESQANYDAWWNSLTNDHKQKLYDDQVAFEELAIEMDIQDRMDIEDEMNHDLGFGK